MSDEHVTDAGWEYLQKRRIELNGAYVPGEPAPEQNDHAPVLADRLLTRSALRNLPDPEPLIDNVLDQGTTALLYGSWGTAKTFISLDWAASVATGRRWQGRDTKQRRVLYVVGEGAFGFKGRIHAWETGWKKSIGDEWLHFLPEPVNLTHPVEVGNLCALVDWGGYSFVILDTLARCMVGAEENSAKDGGIVVDAMTRLLKYTPNQRGVVLGIHHAGKDAKTLRGSSAFESGADTVYFTSRDELGVITLEREKRKDGPEIDSHALRLTQIEATESCVVESQTPATPAANTERANQLSRIYSQMFGATGCTGSQLRDVSNMKKDTFYRALSDLLRSGELINTGTRRMPFYERPENA